MTLLGMGLLLVLLMLLCGYLCGTLSFNRFGVFLGVLLLIVTAVFTSIDYAKDPSNFIYLLLVVPVLILCTALAAVSALYTKPNKNPPIEHVVSWYRELGPDKRSEIRKGLVLILRYLRRYHKK